MAKQEEQLSNKEDWFCREFLLDENATRAYMRVYKESSYDAARAHAARLVAKGNIRQRIDELKASRNKRLEFDADKVLAEIAKLAFHDPADFFDDDGRLKPISELEPDQRAAIAGIETLHKVIGDEKDGVAIVTKIKLSSKLDALEKLGRNLKLFADRLDVTITTKLEDIVGGGDGGGDGCG